MNFDPINDPINDSINDPINDPIKLFEKVNLSDFDLSIVRVISEKPGLNAKQILEELITFVLSKSILESLKNVLIMV